MTAVQRVKDICKDRKIAISKLENDCGFANGYISQLRKGTFPNDRLSVISEYLGVSVDYLMTGKEYDVFSDENAHLFAQIRRDEELSEALLKYFELSDSKKKHVIETIKMLVEV